jgi:hypothetical protein
MTFTILSLTLSYALVVALLTYLLLLSRLHWVLKTLATIATVALIPLNFRGVGELRGLPSDDLKFKLSEAMGDISKGEEIQGTMDAVEALPEDTSEALAVEVELGAAEARPDGSGSVGERVFDFEPSMLSFGTAQAPVTPGKPP